MCCTSSDDLVTVWISKTFASIYYFSLIFIVVGSVHFSVAYCSTLGHPVTTSSISCS